MVAGIAAGKSRRQAAGFPQALIAVWRDNARADIIRIIEHIRLENPIAARRVGREILLAADSITIFRAGAGGQGFRYTRARCTATLHYRL
jgi:plasmid stabilization system protein ParE